jgi:hypothetical protein
MKLPSSIDIQNTVEGFGLSIEKEFVVGQRIVVTELGQHESRVTKFVFQDVKMGDDPVCAKGLHV